MTPETDLKLWAYLIGWIVVVFGGGVAWGYLKHQIMSHQKVIEACKLGDLMTEEKCKVLHGVRQELSDVKLDNIETMLKDMQEDRKDADRRMGRLVSRIDVIYDRWEQQNG